jgi:chemotaxis signal transduction protein
VGTSSSSGSGLSGQSSGTGTTEGGGRRRRGGSGGPVAEGFPETLCGFWLGDQCFAVSATIVGEVVPCESLTPVPMSPPAIRGLFNLRGTPVAVIDLGMALALSDLTAPEEPQPGRPLTLLVLRADDVIVGVLIRRMEMVLPARRGRFRPRGESAEENPLVAGFVEIPERASLVMTVLGAPELIAKLNELRFRREDEE